MNKTCNECTDRGKFFRCPPCATCKHEGGGANGTEDNFRPYIEQEAAYALLAALEDEVNEMRLHYRHPSIKTMEAIANAKGDA
jgi:hypothetical protein